MEEDLGPETFQVRDVLEVLQGGQEVEDRGLPVTDGVQEGHEGVRDVGDPLERPSSH